MTKLKFDEGDGMTYYFIHGGRFEGNFSKKEQRIIEKARKLDEKAQEIFEKHYDLYSVRTP